MNSLPRLLVVTDVPVTDTVAGSLQLYRLLGGYPPDRLCICEGTINKGVQMGLRLPGVRYVTMRSGSARWRRSRLVRLQAVWLTLTMPYRASRIADAIGDFEPEAVLTIAQEFAHFAAATFARERGLPFHMILHDDWLTYSRLPKWFAPIARRQFREVYVAASERWCISPSMEEHYRKQWGAPGQVLLPVCDENVGSGLAPVRHSDGIGMTFAYSGSVPTGGRAKLLLQFAEAIRADGHRLALMVPGGLAAVRGQAAKVGCHDNPGNINDIGYVSPKGVAGLLRECADALLVAETFDPAHHAGVAYNFPCKVADYAAVGLPIIIWAPPYSSAARWARENPHATVSVTSEDLAAATHAARRLAVDPGLRQRMGEAVGCAAKAQFDPAAARERLYRAIAASVEDTIGTRTQE